MVLQMVVEMEVLKGIGWVAPLAAARVPQKAEKMVVEMDA